MDFFEHQDKARQSTRWLVIYFIAAVFLIVVSVYLVCAVIFLRGRAAHDLTALWNPELFLGVTTGVMAVVCFGSLYKIAELREGGGAVARMLGGRLISPTPAEPEEKKLRNVVEEMSLAAGVPVPEIYVLDNEQGINAFAAGHTTADAAVAVTRGTMDLLDRDELQGVIAHEFSHILNGDMRLNLRLMGFIHGILCLAIVGRILLNTGSSRRSSSDDRKGGNPLPLFGIALLIIGGIGVFFGKLIKSAVSRQREFLADASAVQFTRNPLGLASALKKIGGLAAGSQLEAPEAEAASHLFFANGLTEGCFSLMATHPPLAERIRLLDPTFDGNFERVVIPERQREVAELVGGQLTPETLKPVVPPPIRRAAQWSAFKHAVSPATVIGRAGKFTPRHLAYAAEVRAALPGDLVGMARNPFSAVGLVYALLLSGDWATRVAQSDQLKAGRETGVLDETKKAGEMLSALPREARLPLLSFCLPTLRLLSRGQYEKFKANIEQLVQTDGEVDLFEFALQKLLTRHLDPHFTGLDKQVMQYYSWTPLWGDAAILLSALAYAGQESPEQAANAFAIGWAKLRGPEGFSLLSSDETAVPRLSVALDRLAKASPFIKKTMLDAAAFTVAADERVCPPEAELLRVIADVLDCPLPPFIEGV